MHNETIRRKIVDVERNLYNLDVEYGYVFDSKTGDVPDFKRGGKTSLKWSDEYPYRKNISTHYHPYPGGSFSENGFIGFIETYGQEERVVDDDYRYVFRMPPDQGNHFFFSNA